MALVKSKNIKASGFYTQEVRNGRFREGFDVVTLDGKFEALARDQALLKSPAKYSVGKYGVLLEEFENIALPCIDEVIVVLEYIAIITSKLIYLEYRTKM